jgi:hypothetical protein
MATHAAVAGTQGADEPPMANQAAATAAANEPMATHAAAAAAAADGISHLEVAAAATEAALGAAAADPAIIWLGGPVTSKLYDNREALLASVRKWGLMLVYGSVDLRGDREIVREAVKENGGALRFANKELQSDPEIVWEAVRSNPFALQYVSGEWRRDRKLVLQAVTKQGIALEFASEELRGDREIVREALKQTGIALAYASIQLRRDQEIVLEAVSSSGMALQFASEEMRGNWGVVLESVRQDGRALQFAVYHLHNDKRLQPVVAEQNKLAVRGSACDGYGRGLENDPGGEFCICFEFAASVGAFFGMLQVLLSKPLGQCSSQGTSHPVCTVLSLQLSVVQTFRYQGLFGLAGAEVYGEVAANSTVGDLATHICEQHGCKRIFLMLPTDDAPIDPTDMFSPLHWWVA